MGRVSRDTPEGDGYSWFCEQYARHVKNMDVCFHHAYIGGETSFVDYSGTSIDIVERETGEVKKTQLFVWTWGASNYTYLEFTQSQKVPDFLGSHQRGLAYFECVPKRVVPDNLKSAVVAACRYEPQLNYNYERLTEHYGFCVLPARAGHPVTRPRSKATSSPAAVEAGLAVQGVGCVEAEEPDAGNAAMADIGAHVELREG